MPAIHFFNEDISFKLPSQKKHSSLIRRIIQAEKRSLANLNYIFCSDQYLHKINLEYLNHDNYTDIITFDQSDDQLSIEGDIFISVERIKENALIMNQLFEDELIRVMIHGVLHLIGYDDKSDEEKAIMRHKENNYINFAKE
ncbi:MAG: rRNA maturation RNase YbeY [Candidatus Cyclobacteriaceae bacterium M3_2C_046]